MITMQNQIPVPSLLDKHSASFDYIDCFRCQVSHQNPNADITVFYKAFMTSGPSWTEFLLNLRDKAVGIFGLKTTNRQSYNKDLTNNLTFAIGERHGLFKLFDKSENELLLGEDDKHLNFRVSLLIEPVGTATDKTSLSITTAVKFNNLFGRIYFMPVKPIHKLIVRSTLKNIAAQTEKKA